jgi:hypothetical protein
MSTKRAVQGVMSGALAALSYEGALAGALSQQPPPIEGQWFNRKRVDLDGYTFIRCRFDNCEIYAARGSFVLKGCVFSDCTFLFAGDAARIVRLYHVDNRPGTLPNQPPADLAPTFHKDGSLTIE